MTFPVTTKPPCSFKGKDTLETEYFILRGPKYLATIK